MKKTTYGNEMQGQVKKVIIILVVIVILLGGTYLLTTKILKKSNSTTSNKVTKNSIQYDEILAGESFNQNNDEYYVIYFDKSNNSSSFSSLVSSYQLNNTKTRMYSVDLSSGFNKDYVTDGEAVVHDINDFKVKDGTLIKVKNGEVEEVITDTAEITNILNS